MAANACDTVKKTLGPTAVETSTTPMKADKDVRRFNNKILPAEDTSVNSSATGYVSLLAADSTISFDGEDRREESGDRKDRQRGVKFEVKRKRKPAQSKPCSCCTCCRSLSERWRKTTGLEKVFLIIIIFCLICVFVFVAALIFFDIISNKADHSKLVNWRGVFYFMMSDQA